MSVDLDLDFDDAQQALAASVDGYCTRAGVGPELCADDPLPPSFWSGLADLGVLGLGTHLVGGGALEIAAATEALGAHGAPGPLVGTFLAGALLDRAVLEPVVAGDTLVAMGRAPLLSWAPRAGVFLDVTDDGVWLAEPAGEVTPVDTTAGEPWGRVELDRIRSLDRATQGIARSDVALGAYLVGAADRLVTLAAEYAADRVQFGKPIAAFQAVSHPLAALSVRLRAARLLVRTAAFGLDTDDPDAIGASATARLSATRTATAVAYQAHQTFGAMGFTLEGPVAHLAQRIRQLGLTAPGPEPARGRVLAGLGI